MTQILVVILIFENRINQNWFHHEDGKSDKHQIEMMTKVGIPLVLTVVTVVKGKVDGEGRKGTILVNDVEEGRGDQVVMIVVVIRQRDHMAVPRTKINQWRAHRP